MTETPIVEAFNKVRNVKLNRESNQANEYVLGKAEQTLLELSEKRI